MQQNLWLRKKRDTQAAYAFLKRLVKQFDEPKVVVTDKAPSITSAFKKLKEYGFYQGTEHRTIKYLNNLIEQDHRPVKRRNKFYRSLRTASTTIKGMEAIRGLYKKTRKRRHSLRVFLFNPRMASMPLIVVEAVRKLR